MSYLNTALTRAFKVQHPVVLAPMGGASGGELAAAVSRAGGLGLVGASYGDPEWMAAQLPHMKEVIQPWGIG
ncbi:nitronate monooxygenase, partial [Pseudomonas viridiflava]|uniref:nitronate monooxygenase n=1 Tax=Pseudomonas viridiflava TaxID=33069 RepID=UPI00197E94AE